MPDDMIDDTRDALEMMGIPLIQFEAPSRQAVRTKKGIQVVATPGWIKFAIAFRNELPNMKGADLAVFMCICLHVNTDKEAWPSLTTICKEINKSRATVVEAIKRLSITGLLEISRPGKHRSNTYRPLYAAYGSSSEIELPIVQFLNSDKYSSSSDSKPLAVQNLNSNGSDSEPEVEPLSRTNEEEPVGRKAPPPKKTKATKSDYLDNPAVQLYRDKALLTPHPAARKAIAERATNLAAWGKTLDAWALNRWNMQNVAGLLDSYGKMNGGGRNDAPARDLSTDEAIRQAEWDSFKKNNPAAAAKPEWYEKARAQGVRI